MIGADRRWRICCEHQHAQDISAAAVAYADADRRGRMNREQQNATDSTSEERLYVRTENSVFREKLGKKRLRQNDHQRRRVAVKGKVKWTPILGPLDPIVRWIERGQNPMLWTSQGVRKSSD